MKRVGRVWLLSLASFWSILTVSAFGASFGKFLSDHSDALGAIFWRGLDDLETGCAEEALFRYFLMDLILSKMMGLGPNMALAISSILFGLAHFVNGPGSTPQVFEAMAMGAVLGYIYRRYGLWASILLHASFNFFVITVMMGRL